MHLPLYSKHRNKIDTKDEVYIYSINTMINPVLTRYLYIYDEVCLSLQQSLLSKTSFDEVVFWSSELFYSGYTNKLWNLIYKMYYNFYAITYPKYERKINKLFQTPTLKSILNCLCILYYSKINTDVFKLYHIRPKLPTKSYIETPVWLIEMNIDKKYTNFLIALHKTHYINMMYYMNGFDDYKEIYNTVKRYFREVQGMPLNDKSWDYVKYADIRHLTIALILYLKHDDSNITKKSIFRKYSHDKYIDQIEMDNCEVGNKYKTLPSRLRYQISDKIGCFKLKRENLNCSVPKMLWYHWEYFAYNCPLWKKRFDKYKIRVDDKAKKIEFENVDEEEEFYEHWYYEPDEQTKEVQERITLNIPKMCILDWLNLVKN